MIQDEKQLLTIDLCARLPYGVKHSCGGKHPLLLGFHHDAETIDIEMVLTRPDLYKPILRDMSHLTEEITQANYNNGKPFVPIVELNNSGCVKLGLSSFRTYRNEVRTYLLADYHKGVNVSETSELDLLNQWHINWRNLPKHLWIDVESLESNPYK